VDVEIFIPRNFVGGAVELKIGHLLMIALARKCQLGATSN